MKQTIRQIFLRRQTVAKFKNDKSQKIIKLDLLINHELWSKVCCILEQAKSMLGLSRFEHSWVPGLDCWVYLRYSGWAKEDDVDVGYALATSFPDRFSN